MDALQGLPSDALKHLSRELAEEKVLWAGRPSPYLVLLTSLPLLILAVPWTIFAVSWELLALGSFLNPGAGKVTGPGGFFGYVFPFVGIPFIVIGVGMLAAPALGFYKAKRTVHVLTDTRLVSAVLMWRDFAITTVLPEKIVSITRRQKADGSGTLTFLLGRHRDGEGDLVDKAQTWHGVPNASLLEQRLREVIAARKPAA